jgi:hypothetical protein
MNPSLHSPNNRVNEGGLFRCAPKPAGYASRYARIKNGRGYAAEYERMGHPHPMRGLKHDQRHEPLAEKNRTPTPHV